MADRRIPSTNNKIEVRSAFQRLDSDVEILEDGTMSVDAIAAIGSLVVKDSDTAVKSYTEFSQGTDNQVLVSAGVGVIPVWTTDLDGLTLLTVDNITINGAVIISDTGTISFGDENLTTTGIITGGDIIIFGPTPILVFKDSDSLGAASVGFIEWRDSGGGRAGFFGNSSSGNDDLVWKNEQGGNIVIQTTGAGECQIFANVDLSSNDFITTGTLGAGATTVTSLTIGTWTIAVPSAAGQVLIASAANTASWATAGNDKILTSDGTGEVAWESKPFGYLIPANAAQYEVYTGTGVGTAAWTKNLGGLTFLQVDSITINNAMIFSSTGTISFSDDNLTTTGTLGCGAATVTSLTDGTATLTGGSLTAVKLGTLVTNGFVKTSGANGTLSVDTSTYLTAEVDTLDTVADRGATTDQTLIAGGFTTTGVVTVGAAADMVITVGSITSVSGAISFGNENLVTTGTLGAGVTTVSSDLVLASGSITSISGTISFGNELLNTTGKVAVGSTAIYDHSHCDVTGVYAADKYGSQLHLHTTNNEFGLFMGAWASGNAVIATGAHYSSGGNWRAKALNIAGISFQGDTLNFHTDTGKSDGDIFSPTRRLLVDSNGITLEKTSGVGIRVDNVTPTFGWRDLLGETTTRSTGASKPSFETYNGEINQYRFSAGEHEHYDFHIPHDYVAGTDIHLHIHWSQISATNTGGTVNFKYSAVYAKGHNQAAFTGTPITGTFTSADAGTIKYQQHITEIIISGASATAALFDRDDLEPDGVILMTLEMEANNLTDSVGVTDPFIHYADIHYQSSNIATKQKVPDFYV